ncbi:MAG TPA: GAF domain-containing protein, partial [Chloroflexota bacterium]|nr:GAF domain-containing protein [Chloroflexota bacterium]
QQAAGADILRAIASSHADLQAVLQAIAASAARLCEADDAVISQVDGEISRAVAHFGGGITSLGTEQPIDRGSATGRAMTDRRTIHIPDVLAESECEFPVSMPFWRRTGQRTLVATPLLREGEPIGAITLRRTQLRPFSDQQLRLLETFAHQAVIVVENARLFQELAQRRRELAQSVRELKALAEISQAVSSSLDLDQVLFTIVSRANELAGADGGAIFEYDEATERFALRATQHFAEAHERALQAIPMRKGEGAIGRAAASRQPVQIPDIMVPGAYDDRLREGNLLSGFRSHLAIPLLRGDQVVGGLVVSRNATGEFPARVVELLQTFAAQSALAILNARQFRELEEKNRQLEIASRHKSQFLANMSHELRTPLNAILGYTELIQDEIYGPVPPKIREVLERVGKSGRHLLDLINDVLDVSKMEAGELTLSLNEYSLKELVHTVYTALEPLAAEKRLSLTVSLPPDLPMGKGDDRRIYQVLLNLVGNAIKFTERGVVLVRAEVVEGNFVVSICDTGPGIPEDLQPKLFQEFQQGDSSSTRKKGGTGLGLAICKRIVELHGGRIWADTDSTGQGAT